MQGLAGQIGLAILILALGAGCVSAPLDAVALHDCAEARADAALARVRPVFGGPAIVQTADTDRPAAYSWDDGRIVVTRGLIDLMTDDELAAVIAHELGHLCLARGDRVARAPFALRGNGADNEFLADRAGSRLLVASGIPPAALAEALARVRDSALTPRYLKPGLSQRIAVLKAPNP